jgi:hypothetical protein
MRRAACSSRVRRFGTLLWETLSGATPRGRIWAAALIGASLAAIGPDRLGRGPQLCVISAIIRRPCPACGITRAAAALLRGDMRRAYRFNRRIVPLALVVCVSIVRDLRALRPTYSQQLSPD